MSVEQITIINPVPSTTLSSPYSLASAADLQTQIMLAAKWELLSFINNIISHISRVCSMCFVCAGINEGNKIDLLVFNFTVHLSRRNSIHQYHVF